MLVTVLLEMQLNEELSSRELRELQDLQRDETSLLRGYPDRILRKRGTNLSRKRIKQKLEAEI